MKEKILRVNTFTNFNFTDLEFKQLDKIAERYPEYKIFVNSNSFVKLRGKYPAVITINPRMDKFIKPRGDISIVRAARIKYITNAKPIVKKAFDDSVMWCVNNNVPILITYMRFRSESTMKQFTNGGKLGYIWAKNYFRQTHKKRWKSDIFNYCDLKETGCPDCLNCAKLTFGTDNAELYSINLSSSGICKFDCPDCYVKTIVNYCGGISFDRIVQNTKQSGESKYKLYKYGQRELVFDNFVKWNERKNGVKNGADKRRNPRSEISGDDDCRAGPIQGVNEKNLETGWGVV